MDQDKIIGQNPSINNVSIKSSKILDAIQKVKSKNRPIKGFGNGNTAEKFFKILNNENVWKISRQKIQ